MPEGAQPGLREVVFVAAAAVAVILGAAFATGFLPEAVQRVIFHAPLTIIVLLAGTAFVLWRVARHRPPEA